MLHLSYKFVREWHTSETDVKDLTGTDPKTSQRNTDLSCVTFNYGKILGNFKKTERPLNSQGTVNDGIKYL